MGQERGQASVELVAAVPFVIYRVALGALVLVLVASGAIH